MKSVHAKYRSLYEDNREHTSSLGALDACIDVSIIIVSWNTKELLRACLMSLETTVCSLRVEIIVVDNGSRDGTVEMVTNDFSDVRLLVNNRNVGFAVANNQALGQAHGRYLLLLNSDTVVLADAVEKMVHYIDTHPNVGVVGPRLLNEDLSTQLSAHDFPRLDHDAIVLLEVKHWPLVGDLAWWYARRTYNLDYPQTHEVDWVMGACLMLRREAIAQLGLLDEGYIFFFEESDLCYRMCQHGWSRVFLSEAEIIHYGGQSRARIPATSLVWYYKGLLRFYCLHSTLRRRFLVRLAVAVAALGHVAWRLLWPWQKPESGSFVAAYARIFIYAIRG